MAGKAGITLADYGGEKSTATFYVDDFVESTYDSQVSLVASLFTALLNITLGIEVKRFLKVLDVGSGSGQATDVMAQRELKWLVRYSDDVTAKSYQMEVPSPDVSLLSSSARQNMDISGGAGAAFVSAFEAAAVSPDGNAVTVESVTLVGRTL